MIRTLISYVLSACMDSLQEGNVFSDVCQSAILFVHKGDSHVTHNSISQLQVMWDRSPYADLTLSLLNLFNLDVTKEGPLNDRKLEGLRLALDSNAPFCVCQEFECLTVMCLSPRYGDTHGHSARWGLLRSDGAVCRH